MSGDLVSAIFPAYNHQAYICQALESLAAQTHGNIELIIIDDFSADETFALAEAFAARPEMAERFAGISLIKHGANTGAAAAINEGLAMARGDWLTILNSDDEYHPQRLERMLAALKNAGRRHGFSNAALMDEEGNNVRDCPLALKLACLGDGIAARGATGFTILRENAAISSGNLFFARELYERAGDFANLKLAHDWDYLIRLLAFEEPVFVDEPLYRYRLHGNNVSKNLRFYEFFDPLAVYARYFRALECGNYENPLYPLYCEGQNAEFMRNFKAALGREPINLALVAEWAAALPPEMKPAEAIC